MKIVRIALIVLLLAVVSLLFWKWRDGISENRLSDTITEISPQDQSLPVIAPEDEPSAVDAQEAPDNGPPADDGPTVPPVLVGATVLVEGRMLEMLEEMRALDDAARLSRVKALLASGHASERAAGVMAALELGYDDLVNLQAVAQDTASVVPATVMGWLRDGGENEKFAELASAFQSRKDYSMAMLESLALDAETSASAGRALLDLYQSDFPISEQNRFFNALVSSAGSSASLRHEAVVRLAETTSIGEYSQTVQKLSQEHSRTRQDGSSNQRVGSPVFAMMLDSLERRFVAPEPVVERKGLAFSKFDAIATARLGGLDGLDALATQVEQAVRTGSYVETGTSQAIKRAIEEATTLTPTAELIPRQQAAARRLEALLPEVEAAEKAAPEGFFVDDAPPGATTGSGVDSPN